MKQDGQVKLNDVTVFHVHQDHTRELDVNKIAHSFNQKATVRYNVFKPGHQLVGECNYCHLIHYNINYTAVYNYLKIIIELLRYQ